MTPESICVQLHRFSFVALRNAEEESGCPRAKEQSARAMVSDTPLKLRKEAHKHRPLQSPFACQICEQKASCYHYGVPSCNGCKTFFRRAVLSKYVQSCPQDGKCPTKAGFPFCRSCRYEKCIRAGMNPKGVGIQTATHQPTIELISAVYLQDNLFDIDLNGLLYVEKKVEHLRYSTFFPYSRTTSITDCLSQPCILNYSNKYKVITKWKKPPEYVTFTDRLAHEGFKQWAYMDALLAIEFYKSMSVFQRLSVEDQLALMKSTIVQHCIFHPSYDAYFRKNTCHIVHPDGYHPFSHEYFLKDELSQAVRKGVLAGCVANEVTREKVVLLKMIISLNSAAPNLTPKARELIAEERFKFAKALMKLVQLESNSTTWIKKYQLLYDLVNQNLSVAQKMTDLFFMYYLPIISTDATTIKLWSELFV